MMNKTKFAFAVLLLLQIAPAAQAASKGHHSNSSALSPYDYAQDVFGWGRRTLSLQPRPRLIPSDTAPERRQVLGEQGNGNLGWIPC